MTCLYRLQIALVLLSSASAHAAYDDARSACLQLTEIMGKFAKPATAAELRERTTTVAQGVTEFIAALEEESGTADSDAAAKAFRELEGGKIWSYQTGAMRLGPKTGIPSDAVLRRMRRLLLHLGAQGSAHAFYSPTTQPLRPQEITVRPPPPSPLPSRREFLFGTAITATGVTVGSAANQQLIDYGQSRFERKRDEFLNSEIALVKQQARNLTLTAFREALLEDISRSNLQPPLPARYPFNFASAAKQSEFKPDKVQELFLEYTKGVEALTLETARTDWETIGEYSDGQNATRPVIDYFNYSFFAHRFEGWTRRHYDLSDTQSATVAGAVISEIFVAGAGLIAHQSGLSTWLANNVLNWRPRRATPIPEAAPAPIVETRPSPADPFADPIAFLVEKSEAPAHPFIPVQWYYVGANNEDDLHTDIILRVDRRTQPTDHTLLAVQYREKEINYWPPGASPREQFTRAPDSRAVPRLGAAPQTPQGIEQEMRVIGNDFKDRFPEALAHEFNRFDRLMVDLISLKLAPNEVTEIRATVASLSALGNLAPLQALYDKLAARRQ